MWSYVAHSVEREVRLLEQERLAMRRLVWDELPERPTLRERLDATRALLSRRERKVLDRNSILLPVREGTDLEAPSRLATRQFVLLEQGRAGLSVDGEPVEALRPGDLVAHAPGTSIRALTERSEDVV